MCQADWSLLPPELIQFISEKIPCITNYVYFRAVCWSWRLASLPKPCHLPPQLPWLLLPTTSFDELITDPEVLFYDLNRSKISKLFVPAIQGSKISGASRGWLILEKNHKVVLCNPVTRATIPVSSLDGVPNIFPIPEKLKLCPSDWILPENGESYVRKAILTSSPYDSGCMVVGLFLSKWVLAFCRIGDECWTLLQEYDGSRLIADIAWHNNLLYAIDSIGGVFIYDLYSPSKKFVFSYEEHLVVGPTFLVEGASEPLAVVQHYPFMSEVYKYEGQPAWHQVHDTGNIVLFVNNYPSQCISIPCAYSQSNRWRGRRIYSEKRSSSSVILVELKELGGGYAEDTILEDIIREDLDITFWLTPSYF